LWYERSRPRDGLLHEETQVHERGIDLTVAEVFVVIGKSP
jgi:hypothetical protein